MSDKAPPHDHSEENADNRNDSQIYSRLSNIPTSTDLQLDNQTPEPERMKLYFKYAIAFENYLRKALNQDPPPADISEAIWKKFMTMNFEHRGRGTFRKYLRTILNSSINSYRSKNAKLTLSDGDALDITSNNRMKYLKHITPGDQPISNLTDNQINEETHPMKAMHEQTIDDIEHYTKRLENSLETDESEKLGDLLASEDEIKSIVRRILQSSATDRLNQIEKESREIDKQSKRDSTQADKAKRGDSRWKYIVASKICAEYRLDSGRSTADVQELVEKLKPIVHPETVSSDLAKKWASRGSQIYARALVQAVADMLATDAPESLEEELAELGLLSIKFVRDVLADSRRPFL